MNAAFRRVIRIATRQTAGGMGEARAVVEDDYHHFRVIVHHDGQRVLATATNSLRSPFTLCGAAGTRLQELVGMPLSSDMTAAFRKTEARLQCTHQFDIAALAIAAAARESRQRRYELAIPDSADGRTLATLSRDGQEILYWEMEGATIAGPAFYAGRSIGSGFTDWVASQLPEQDAEAALVLRRGVFIAVGRRIESPGSHAKATGGCWVQQPERNERALAMADSRQDFSGRPESLTAVDDEWIRFAA